MAQAFRRASITWRQQIGGSAIEASKIAGHSGLEMTGQYTFVEPERRNELTRRIQKKLSEAGKKFEKLPLVSPPIALITPEVPHNLAASTLVQ